ncbi:hypothetical protein [Amycolatopsis anabasis]|uniref:hypothetical protein n=1 Tax=Amycolatopsis anabasis TaxID=1840409 RepID=UPI001FE35967|nr:hypothetical protein [Amycolatopsis anabasis]
MMSPRAQSGAEPEGPGVSQGEAERLAVVAHWADGYCVAVGQLLQTLSGMPIVDPSSAERASQSSGAVLGAMASGLDRTVRNLRSLPPSPVAGGEGVRNNAIGTFTGVLSRTTAAKQRLEATAVGSPENKQALVDASGPLNEVSKINLLGGFDAVPDLAGAAGRAPSCQQLTAPGGPSPSLSTSGTPAN